LHVERLTRWNLADEHAALRLERAAQLEKRPEALARAGPRRPRDGGDVRNTGDVEMDRDALAPHPAIVGIPLPHLKIRGIPARFSQCHLTVLLRFLMPRLLSG